MSKIGKKTINIPEGVSVKIDGSLVSVKGPKGEMSRLFPSSLKIEAQEKELRVFPLEDSGSRDQSTSWGLVRALLANMIQGVSQGFEKVLEFQGVGYRAAVKGNSLELGLGFSHPVVYSAPEGIAFKTEKNTISISGIDKELVGKVAAEIRSYREPEPYKGSGIRYRGEVVRRKAGKKAAASA